MQAQAKACGYQKLLFECNSASYVVSQLQLHGVGVEVELVFQVGLVIFPDIVIDQGDRHHQRHVALVVITR